MKATQSFIGSPWYTFTTELGTKVLVLGYLYNFTQEVTLQCCCGDKTHSFAGQRYNSSSCLYLGDAGLFQASHGRNGRGSVCVLSHHSSNAVISIVVVAHIDPTEPPELEQIYHAIRAYHPATPLAMFSGHR